MILNSLMITDARYLCGNWSFYVPFTIWPKVNLGHET